MKTVEDVRREINTYIICCGGILSILEADETFNDYSREMVEVMKNQYGTAYLANSMEAGKNVAYSYVEFNGQLIHNFEFDICVPKADEKLLRMIYSWNNHLNNMSIDNIHDYLKEINGSILLWR